MQNCTGALNPLSHAVLIADVRASAGTQRLRALLTQKLKSLSQTHRTQKLIRLPYAVTAGDEFQTLVSVPEHIPQLILDLRRRMRPLDLWIGIGIGEISGAVRPPVNHLSGEAFRCAREALKSKPNSKINLPTAFCSSDEEFDKIANCVYALHDSLLHQITSKQWRTIDAYFQSGSVDGAAKRLGVGISTASRNLRRGHLWLLLETAARMKDMIQRRFS